MMAISGKSKIHLHLHAPDTTLIHRAGILGLWMTLKQLEKQFPTPDHRLGGLSWELTPYSVSLDWEGQDKTVLDWLLKQAFQVDDRGLISLTGLNPQSMPLINKIHLHQVLTGTLLQYNRGVTTVSDQSKVSGTNLSKTAPRLLLYCLINLAIPWQFYLFIKGKPNPQASEKFQVDGVKFYLNYKQLTSYVHQNFSHHLCSQTTERWIDGYVPIVSWLFPGAVIRHSLISKHNQCQEKTEYAFALLFLPIACNYLIFSKCIAEQIKSIKTYSVNYLLVVPDPVNLEKTAQIRWRLNDTKYPELYVSSLEEAAFSYYLNQIPNSFDNARCQIILYEKLMKDSWLRGPTNIQDFKITKISLKNYRLAYYHLPRNKLRPAPTYFLIANNLIRGIIADNLLAKQSIWTNLWLTLTQKDSYGEIRQQLKCNQQGLFTMIKNSDEITKAHHAFIDVIHEALKIIYARIYQNNPAGASKKIERENEQLKSQLLDCYKEETFRHLIAKFLSKAGNLSSLHENRRLVLPILTGKIDWEEARDITLIALCSYPTQARLSRDILIFFVFALLFEDRLYRLALIFL